MFRSGRKTNPALPEMPIEVEHLWEAFADLNRARQSGMSASPISYTEIDAYCRRVCGDLSPWEIGTIMEVDQAVLGNARTKAGQPAAKTEADAGDGAAVGALFKGMGAKKGRRGG